MGIVTVIDSSVDEASSYGVSAVVLMLMQLTILLSANLGVMNLLPIPRRCDKADGKPVGSH